MPVDAVGGDVERAVLEPLDRDVAGKPGVLDLGKRLDPVDALAVLGPELVGMLDRIRVHLEIPRLVDPGALRRLARNGKSSLSGIARSRQISCFDQFMR